MRVCVVFCSMILFSTELLAVCSVPQPRLVCAEYFASKVVVEAKLVRSQYIAPANDIDGHVYHMQAAKTLRGEIGPTFDVWQENSNGRAGFNWEPGRSYLSFFYREENRGWVLDGCGNSGPLENKNPALQQLKARQKRNGGMIQVAVGGDGWSWSPPMKGVKVSAHGMRGTFSATTNNEGIAEIQVPAGQYSVTVPNQQVELFDLSYDDPRKVAIENGGCAQIQFVKPQKTQ